MFCLLHNSCRGSLNHTINSFTYIIRKHASPAVALEIPFSEKIQPKRRPPIVIKCKNESLNYTAGRTYEKFKPIPLASKGWRHNKSVGDYFVVYPDYIQPEPALDNTELASFEELGLNKQLIENLRTNYIDNPSEIQNKAIPILLSRKNCVIAAETGCGKTLAYLLPMLQQITHWKKLAIRSVNEPLGVIIVPSRDLAQQIGIVAKKMSADTDIKIQVLIGGHTKKKMLNPVVDEVDLLIGSLGIISKFTTTSIQKTSSIRHMVLDEADTLLDDSFTEKLRHYLKKITFDSPGMGTSSELPSTAQLTLVSATMPTEIPATLEAIVDTNSLVRLTTDKLHRILPQVRQKFIRVSHSSRSSEVLKIAKKNSEKKRQTLIFCNTVKSCEWLYLFLSEMSVNCSYTHGTLPARVRLDRFAEFQRGHTTVLVTTDACSRGLDTTTVKHVVNFDFPLHTADYIHRCGRTGRLGGEVDCQVTNFISGDRDVELAQKIEMSIRKGKLLPKVDGNITKIVKDNIERNIAKVKELLNANMRPRYSEMEE
ncbi:probable ATP-dependent RNA helicase DDX28 isoform X1 [Neodiprion virginianus]|uniref:probable ATP-dependent RNA helicase DDX28 isoform X1 n=1 Tax=Neodiprion virginianus TaxID=2961670 RepID=UPI001EE7119E|nr:probable ATP-dependent RNA helicase DDX28 isoform X1 [Neodiprion virginianus]